MLLAKPKRKIILGLTLCSLSAMLVSAPAEAARSRKRATVKSSEEFSNLTVSVPTSPILMIEEAPAYGRAPRFEVELGAGYSQFLNLRADSYAVNAEAFRQMGWPSVSLRAVSRPLIARSGISVVATYGVAMTQLERSGTVQHDFLRATQSQRMTLIPATVGAEFRVERWARSRVQPLVQVLVHPTLGLVAESILGEDQTFWGVSVEPVLALRVPLGALDKMDAWPDLAVMAGRSWGRAQGYDLASYQFSLAARVPLDF